MLRVLNRFQRVAGFDRAIALASSAFTALVPLAVLTGAVLPHVDASHTAHSIIVRYGLTDGGAQAVKDVLAPATGTSTGVSVLGAFLLVVATLSFSRAMQRLFEQTWGLRALSVRNTVNDLIWIVGLVCYVGVTWRLHGLIDHGHVRAASNVLMIPASAIFLAWSGRILSAKRLAWHSLVPFAILGAALYALYQIGAEIYVPRLFSTYASRYGVIGAVLAMISTLFGVMLVLVASAATGQEVSEELGRIQRGERPPDDEIQREWNALIAEARSRWEVLRQRLDRPRRGDRR